MKRFLLLGTIAVALSGCVSEYPSYGGYDAYGDGYRDRPAFVDRDHYRTRPSYRDYRRSDRGDYRPSYREPSRPRYQDPSYQQTPSYRGPYQQPVLGNGVVGPRDNYVGNEYQLQRERRNLYGGN